MATIAPKQLRVGGAELESVLAEASGFTPAKFPGFERLARRIGENAGERLGLNGAFEFELAYSDAEAMSTELVFTAGLEKNVNFGLKIAPFGVPGMISIARPVLYGWLEFVLGGSRNEEIVYPERDPTELELRIGRLFCRNLCDALFHAFDGFPEQASAEIVLPDAESVVIESAISFVPTEPKSLPSSPAITVIVIGPIASIQAARAVASTRFADAAASNSERRASNSTKFSEVANIALPLGIK